MRFVKAGTLFLAAFALVAFSPALAFGHATVVDTTPEKSATVAEISEVSITANEELLDIGKNAKGFVLTVRNDAGHFFGDGCISVRRDTASMPVTLSEAGRYRVAYRIVSNDGHPIEGKFTFTFGGIEGSDPAPAYAEPPVCGKSQTPITSDEPIAGPTAEPTPVEEPAVGFDPIPWIGIATIPFIVGAIVLLMRILGKSDSEDHLT